jgi:drug/metabolite transporter (DMT)-like permease
MRRSPRLLLVLSAAAFGGTWVAAPWAVAEIPPLAVACVRFAIAVVLLFAWCRARGLRIDPRLADLPIVLGVAATSVVGYNVLFLYGVRLAPPSHGAVITPGFIPIITLVLTRVVLGERFAPRQAIGGIVALAGLALVIGPAFAAGSDELVGDVMFAVSAFTWSVYTIIGRAATRRFDAAVITFLGAAVGALAFLVLSLVLEPGGFGSYGTVSLQALAGVAYLGSLGTVVSFVFFYLGVQRLGAARASSYSVLIPLFGVAATIALLGAPLEPLALAGAALVIGGLWLMQARTAQRSGSDATEASAAAPAR